MKNLCLINFSSIENVYNLMYKISCMVKFFCDSRMFKNMQVSQYTGSLLATHFEAKKSITTKNWYEKKTYLLSISSNSSIFQHIFLSSHSALISSNVYVLPCLRLRNWVFFSLYFGKKVILKRCLRIFLLFSSSFKSNKRSKLVTTNSLHSFASCIVQSK